MTEKKEKKRTAEAGVAPWVGYNEEETMKSQMLALSQVLHLCQAMSIYLVLLNSCLTCAW